MYGRNEFIEIRTYFYVYGRTTDDQRGHTEINDKLHILDYDRGHVAITSHYNSNILHNDEVMQLTKGKTCHLEAVLF